MKFLTEKNFARASALASIMVLGALGPNMLYSSTHTEDATSRVLIQGSDVDTLVSLVEAAGGTVSQKLNVMKAVEVQLTFEQLTIVSESAAVHRIILDNQASIDAAPILLAGRNYGHWWNYREEPVDTPAILVAERNYGHWWNYRQEPIDTAPIVEAERNYGHWWNV